MDLYLENGGVAPRLRTARLTLRPIVDADRDAVMAAFEDYEVVRWLTGVPYPYAPADFDDFVHGFIPDTHHLVWAMDAGDGLIGCIGVQPELGYWLDASHHRKGLMWEAAVAVLDWYFEQTDAALESGYILGNGPSSALLGRLGFADSHLREGVTTARGETVDVQRMELGRATWAARHD